MDTRDNDRELVERILTDYASIPYPTSDAPHTQTIFDRTHDRYVLMNVGWEQIAGRKERVYYPLIQIDLIDGKFWIQHDGTDVGIAKELERGGIPKTRIVLAFREPEVRPYTEYATG